MSLNRAAFAIAWQSVSSHSPQHNRERRDKSAPSANFAPRLTASTEPLPAVTPPRWGADWPTTLSGSLERQEWSSRRRSCSPRPAGYKILPFTSISTACVCSPSGTSLSCRFGAWIEDRSGGVTFPADWLVLDVFAQRGGRWQLVRRVQAWAVAPVQPVTVDSAALQAFVGRYAVAPGYVDDVHWESGHLVATISGYPPGGRLVPVSASVFSPDGVGALIAFERDPSGRVTGYVQGYPDGHVVRRPKLP